MLEWYNLIFFIPIAVGLALIAGSALGLGHDAGHDVGHDVHHDVGHGDGHGHDQDHGHHEQSTFSKALSVLGIGRAPLTVVLMIMSFLFGGIGFISNVLLKPVLITPYAYFWVSLAAAFFGMVVGTGKIARLVYRVLPSTETYSITKHELVGRTGELMLPADTNSGLASVQAPDGSVLQVACRTYEGSLPKGGEILVVDYKEEGDLYVVAPMPVEQSSKV